MSVKVTGTPLYDMKANVPFPPLTMPLGAGCDTPFEITSYILRSHCTKFDPFGLPVSQSKPCSVSSGHIDSTLCYEYIYRKNHTRRIYIVVCHMS